LITVPACDEHNNQRSGLDERFREFVSLNVGTDTPLTEALWQPTLRALNRNPKRKQRLLAGAFRIPESDQIAVPIEGAVFHQMLKSITHALYWHHYRDRLGGRIEIETWRIKPSAPLPFLSGNYPLDVPSRMM
jgi:hypothetical protein